MKILFLTHYFWPESNAPAVRVYEMTRRWVEAGHDVTVLTGAPNVPDGKVYDGYRNSLLKREVVPPGVNVVRVWTFIAANEGTVRRIMNYVSYTVSAVLVGLFLKKPDVIIATSPQFYCGWAGAILKVLKRARFVLEVRDLWPESIVAVGALKDGPLVRYLERSERRLYRKAKHIVTVGEGYRSGLLKRGVGEHRISVVPNGVDPRNFLPGPPSEDALKKYNPSGKFTCTYAGTIGMACGLEVVLEAAKLLKERGNDDIQFVLAGGGARRAELEDQAQTEGLLNVVFTGRLARGEVVELLKASDVCLVHLRKSELFKSVLPSKIFEAAAMEKPIILGVRGAAESIVKSAGAGICIEPENAGELMQAVTDLADDAQRGADMGRAGREGIAGTYNYDKLAADYLDVLKEFVLKVNNE